MCRPRRSSGWRAKMIDRQCACVGCIVWIHSLVHKLPVRRGMVLQGGAVGTGSITGSNSGLNSIAKRLRI